MGYNTVVLIMNDSLNELRNNPEQFISKLSHQTTLDSEDFISVGSHSQASQIMRPFHSDSFKLYAASGNLLTEMSIYNYFLFKRCEIDPIFKEEIIRRTKLAEAQLWHFAAKLNSI